MVLVNDSGEVGWKVISSDFNSEGPKKATTKTLLSHKCYRSRLKHKKYLGRLKIIPKK